MAGRVDGSIGRSGEDEGCPWTNGVIFFLFFFSFLGKMSWSRTEGGRLEKELAYMRRTLGEGAGSTHQILIQTPSNGQGGSLLSRDALLAHLRAVQAATKVTVEMFDT